jgi:hypothetical protein
MQEVDPLDAFMQSLSSEVRSVAAAGHVDRSQLPQTRNQQIASNVPAVARRRRYAKLAALTTEGYFDDDAMRERNPALFHSMLGEYLGETLQEGSGDYEDARHITAEDVRQDMVRVRPFPSLLLNFLSCFCQTIVFSLANLYSCLQ